MKKLNKYIIVNSDWLKKVEKLHKQSEIQDYFIRRQKEQYYDNKLLDTTYSR